jgi:hypothetical protein
MVYSRACLPLLTVRRIVVKASRDALDVHLSKNGGQA